MNADERVSAHHLTFPSHNPLRLITLTPPQQQLNLLRTLIIWSLQSSEYINTTIKNSYKQNRHDDDLNQPLFVPPWGHDTRKRAYYLIEGQNDTPFRIYVEADRKGGSPSWWSVASTIDEAKSLARDLRAESGQAAHRLAQKILAAVPLLEQRDDVRAPLPHSLHLDREANIYGHYRNANAKNTANNAKPNSPAPNPATPSTKAARAASVPATLSKMTKTTNSLLKIPAPVNRAANLELPLPHPVRLLQLVAGKSARALARATARLLQHRRIT